MCSRGTWMLRCRHREWLALTTFVVLVGACELNPQPDLPNNEGSGPAISGAGGSLNLGSGGTSSDPAPGDAGSDGAKGGNAGQIPEDSGGQSSDAGAGGQGAGGESGGQGGESGQGGDSAAGQAGAAGGDAP